MYREVKGQIRQAACVWACSLQVLSKEPGSFAPARAALHFNMSILYGKKVGWAERECDKVDGTLICKSALLVTGQ